MAMEEVMMLMDMESYKIHLYMLMVHIQVMPRILNRQVLFSLDISVQELMYALVVDNGQSDCYFLFVCSHFPMGAYWVNSNCCFRMLRLRIRE